MRIYEDLLGNKYLKSKDFNEYLNDTVFIFDDLSWESIKLIFESFDIDISKGNSSRRDVLSTLDHNLSIFCFHIGVFFESNIIYSSFNSLNLNKYPNSEDFHLESEADAKYIAEFNKSPVEVSCSIWYSILERHMIDALNYSIKSYILIDLAINYIQLGESVDTIKGNFSDLSPQASSVLKYFNITSKDSPYYAKDFIPPINISEIRG